MAAGSQKSPEERLVHGGAASNRLSLPNWTATDRDNRHLPAANGREETDFIPRL